MGGPPVGSNSQLRPKNNFEGPLIVFSSRLRWLCAQHANFCFKGASSNTLHSNLRHTLEKKKIALKVACQCRQLHHAANINREQIHQIIFDQIGPFWANDQSCGQHAEESKVFCSSNMSAAAAAASCNSSPEKQTTNWKPVCCCIALLTAAVK